ncbi:MAG: FtsW/RodA/SpoVE family cell cycle protein [Gloeomargaritaceae cyanobacterium C42_A2020_066]|nr:FtsW/RodA/SpoVE family cell cycle protein [Gloeomargaritaceae cyanobacterium C42_A2020_066]
MRHFFLPFTHPQVSQWAAPARWLQRLTFLWLLAGLLVLYSASFAVQDANGDGFYIIKRQLVWAAASLALYHGVIRCPLKTLLRFAAFGLLACLGLLLTTLLAGTEVNEASRWIALGPLLIQPSELVKPFLVLQGARLFGRWPRLSWGTRGLWLGIFLLVIGAILKQPNLSMAALTGISLWLMAMAGGLPGVYLGGSAVVGAAAGVISISLREYQRLRVISFLDPWADPLGNGYQLTQSLMAVGSGGILGSGFGLSHQKLFYLPIQDTDFIFAVFAEEWGLVGGLLFLTLLAAYCALGIQVAQRLQDPVQRLVATGATVFLIGQSLLNIGVVTGALPTTGLPLPFFSYGGNSLLVSLVLAGFLVRAAREAYQGVVIPLRQPSQDSRPTG